MQEDVRDLVIITGFVHRKEPVRDVNIRTWSAVWTQGDENSLAPFPKEGPNTIRRTACTLGPGDHNDIKKFLSDDTRVGEDWGPVTAPVSSTSAVNKGRRPRKHPTAAAAAGAAATPAAWRQAPPQCRQPPDSPPWRRGRDTSRYDHAALGAAAEPVQPHATSPIRP